MFVWLHVGVNFCFFAGGSWCSSWAACDLGGWNTGTSGCRKTYRYVAYGLCGFSTDWVVVASQLLMVRPLVFSECHMSLCAGLLPDRL